MANEEAHVRLALRNQATIDHLRTDAPKYSEWITTVAFYKALHIVEAVFFRNGGNHGTDHEDRARRLKEARYSHIWKHYRPLWAASTVARYLQDTIQRSGSFNSFAEYMPAGDVDRLILNHYLHQVQQSARNFLSTKSVTELGLTPPKPKKPSS